jgi:hypothetical protein
MPAGPQCPPPTHPPTHPPTPQPLTLRVEVMRDLARPAGQLVTAAHAHHFAGHAQQGVQHVPQLDGPNPLPAAHKLGRLVAQVHQSLLDGAVGGRRGSRVALGLKPGGDRLQGAVGAPPPAVVDAVLAEGGRNRGVRDECRLGACLEPGHAGSAAVRRRGARPLLIRRVRLSSHLPCPVPTSSSGIPPTCV